MKTFPLAEKELSKEVEAAPMSKKEKAFIKDEQDEEFLKSSAGVWNFHPVRRKG